MIIGGSLLIVCFMLLLGVSVYVAFGSVLIFIALVGDQSITGYLPTGSTGIRSLGASGDPALHDRRWHHGKR